MLRRKANWIGNIVRINCLLFVAIEGLGTRTQLIDDLRKIKRYWELKEEA